MQKKVLITGGSGLLAVNWALSICEDFAVTLLLHYKKISLPGVYTDIVSLNSLDECLYLLDRHQPDIVINSAGIANIEECESNPDLAKKVNVDLANNIAIACSQKDVKLVHISTDHLFLGDQEFVTEKTNPCPINNYSRSKLQGEQKVIENCKSALIVRTNFFGWGTKYRQSFSDFILKKLKNKEHVDLFSDVFFTPILISELAKKTHQLINLDASGIFNIVGNNRISKYDYGIKIARCFKQDSGLINAISINAKSGLVKRPKDMSLSNSKLCKVLNCKVSSIDEQFEALKEQESKSAYNQVAIDVIPYGKHYIDEDDIQSVVDLLRHGMLTQGPKVQEFESKMAKYVGAKYAVAVSSGTAALHLACMALGLTKGDEVITSPNTFVATSNSVLYVGAKPVFVDIDEKTLNIDIEKIEKTILNSKNIKAIFPVHFAGLPCNMDRINQLALKYNLSIVEDASHALGATYKNGKRVGNCQYSDMTTLSFHPVKGIAAGEGGMIITNNPTLYRKLSLLRSHGITKGNFEFPGISFPDSSLLNKDEALENGELKRWYYEMQYLGYNYRITDIQCALAMSQMDKVNLFLETRKSIVKFYDQAFLDVPNLTPLQVHDRNNSAHHIYVISIDFVKVGISRNKFMQKLADQGVGSQVHYIPVLNQPYYQSLNYNIESYPIVNKYYQTTLSIPLYYGLTEEDKKLVVSSIKRILE